MASVATVAQPGVRVAWKPLLACAVLAALFAILSMSAALTKCATIDEPLHAVGAYLHVFHRDHRIDPEDPPLWKYWAMLPHNAASLSIDRGLPDFALSLQNTEYETRFSLLTLYSTPGNDGEHFIEGSRWMMMPLGIVLAGLTGAWAWRLAGRVAAIVAMALFCLDPNIIAHAPLVKNDVAITLMLFATAMAMGSLGRRLTWWNLSLLALLCGATLTTKFSGVLVVPMLVLAMLARAILPEPWRIGSAMEMRSTGRKLILAAAVCIVCALVSALFIWAMYGFRFHPTLDPSERLNFESQVERAKANAFYVREGRLAGEDELAQMPGSPLVRAVQWVERNRLLPHAYLHGFLFTYHSSLVRSALLMGRYSDTGWWYYFPLALLFKTPLPTLIVLLSALGWWIISRAHAKARDSAARVRLNPWTTLCITLPIFVYSLSALTSNLNLGLRHIFPIYPFLFILIGIGAARLHLARPGMFRPVALVLSAGLAVETFAAFPDYIPFFNTIFRPHRLQLLGDSNLDWGQDLPALARWQAQHPLKQPLYFAYFGAVPPDRAYGIDYTKIPGGSVLRERIGWPEESGGVIAISATILQGIHLPPSLREYYRPLRESRPRQILGESIYLFDVPNPPLPRPTLKAVERDLQLEREHIRR